MFQSFTCRACIFIYVAFSPTYDSFTSMWHFYMQFLYLHLFMFCFVFSYFSRDFFYMYLFFFCTQSIFKYTNFPHMIHDPCDFFSPSMICLFRHMIVYTFTSVWFLIHSPLICMSLFHIIHLFALDFLHMVHLFMVFFITVHSHDVSSHSMSGHDV